MRVHGRLSQEAKASLLHTGAEHKDQQRPQAGFCKAGPGPGAWLEARVQHSLTLLTQLHQLDTLTAWALGGGNESPFPPLWVEPLGERGSLPWAGGAPGRESKE